jgi:acetylglutamate kinase
LAGALSARIKASRLVVAGGTAGVLDADGHTLNRLDGKAISSLVASGTATAGMVAKLSACRSALKGGVKSVAIVDGREAKRLVRAVAGEATDASTRISL